MTASADGAPLPTAAERAGPYLVAVLGLILTVVVGLRYAEPILDGDLFFHLAYARQILDSGSLVPDHTLYSWTPASNAMVYCNWASELVLAALWRGFGPPALFALRYAVVGGTLLLLWLNARRTGALAGGVAAAALVFLILTLVAVGERAGTLVKPDLFSLLFLHLVLWSYFRAKADPARAGVLWLVPLIMVLWANSHGGFILLAPFLALSAAGELLNRRFSPHCALPRPALRRLFAAWSLCGVAVLATPYGWRYPRQLVDEYLLHRTPRPDTAWNNAYQAVLAWPNLAAEHLPLVVSMALVLGALLAVQSGLAASGARADWSIVLVNAAYVPLYLLYLRSTSWWPVVFGWSAVALLAQLARLRAAGLLAGLPERAAAGLRAAAATAAVLATLWLSARTVRAAILQPAAESWLGFGIGYVNPVVEAEYLARRPLSAAERARQATRLYNIFDSGGYLLWRLYPRYRVMTDSRSFPYLSWFLDQYRFTNGYGFADFLARYPADLAVIDHEKERCQRNFLESPDWRPVFYGPTAAIFVRRGAERAGETSSPPAHGGIDHLRNAATALMVFDFAAAAGDRPQAWSALAQLEGPLRRQVAASHLDVRRAYRDAWRAQARGDFERARNLLRQGLVNRNASDGDKRALLLLDRRAAALAAGRPRDALLAEDALRALAASDD
jgi:hypothetical protein